MKGKRTIRILLWGFIVLTAIALVIWYSAPTLLLWNAERAIAAVERLRADIGIPARLSQLGVTESQLRSFAEKAFEVKRILRVNPREVTVEALEGILRAAL